METLPAEFVLGLILGMVFGLLLAALFYGIPALWWALVDLDAWTRADNSQPSVDDLLDLESCDLCFEPLTDDNAAITCDAHRYCVDCDDHSNRCTACAYARGLALIEERS